jgi:hypothetical protein
MTSQPNLDPPPRGAAWLLSLFANAEESDSILGDLSEEFSQLASQSGIACARRWYWRQTLKSLPHLIGSALRVTPWSTIAAVAGGFLVRRLMAGLPGFAIFSLVERFHIYERHFITYRFLVSTGIDFGHVLTFLLVGCVVALLARRREMTPAIALAMIFGVMALVASLSFVIRGGDYVYLLRLGWYFTDSLAVVLGALIVRMLRSNAIHLSTTTIP